MAAQKWHSKGTGKNWKCRHGPERWSGTAPASVCADLRVLTDAQNATKTDIKRALLCPSLLPAPAARGDLARRACKQSKKQHKKRRRNCCKCHQKKAETAQKVTQKKTAKRRKRSVKKRAQKFEKIRVKKDCESFEKFTQKKMHPGRPHKTPRNGCMKRKNGRKVRKSTQKYAQKKTPARGRGNSHSSGAGLAQ